MPLYLVGPAEYDYDQFDSFVVRAPDEETARALAVEEAKSSRDPENSANFLTCPCKELSVTGEAEVVLGSFNAG